MRKNLPLVVIVLLATACLCIAQSGATSKSKSKNAGASSFEQMIISKSRATWEAYKNRDIAAVKALTPEDYESFSLLGSSNLQQDIDSLNNKTLTIESYSIDDARVSMAAKNVAILRYKCNLRETFQGKPFNAQIYATEVWVNRGGKWQIVSYQETPVS